MGSVINKDGYRLNVGIVIINDKNQVLLGRRNNGFKWQYPQGGIQPNENEDQAFYRELKEEIGLDHDHVQMLCKSKHWYSYKLPAKFIRTHKANQPHCIGQIQKWFISRLVCDESRICLTTSSKPEFADWNWFEMDESINHAIYFKRKVYKQMIAEFKSHIFGNTTSMDK